MPVGEPVGATDDDDQIQMVKCDQKKIYKQVTELTEGLQ